MDRDNSNGGNGNRDSSSSSEEDHSVDQPSSNADDPPSLADSLTSSSAYSTQTTASDHAAFQAQRTSLARNGAPVSSSTESVQPSTSRHNVNPSSSGSGHVQPSTSAHFVAPGPSTSTGQVQPSTSAHSVRPSSSSTEGRSSPASSLSDYVPSSSPAHFVAPGTSSGGPHAVAGSSRWTLYSPPPLPHDDQEEGGRSSRMSRRHSEDRPSLNPIAERKRRSSVQEGSKSLQQKVTGEGSERKMSHEKLMKRSTENVSQPQRGEDGMIDILQREQSGIRLLQKCYLNLIGSAGAGIENSGISDELMLQVYREIMDDLVVTFAQLDMSRFHELAGGVLDWLRDHLSLDRLEYLVQIISQDSSEEPEDEPS